MWLRSLVYVVLEGGGGLHCLVSCQSPSSAGFCKLNSDKLALSGGGGGGEGVQGFSFPICSLWNVIPITISIE